MNAQRFFAFWQNIRQGIALLVFMLVLGVGVGIGKLFDVDVRQATSFGVLIALAAAGIAIIIISQFERLVFGKVQTRRLPGWLKIVVVLGIIGAVGLAILDGLDARQRAASHPIDPFPQLSRPMILPPPRVPLACC